MTFQEDLQDLIRCYNDSPFPSFKVTSYFPAYAQLFRHLRNAKCTFIETGVLNGGSLFMWRSWLGEQARIIGCDHCSGVHRQCTFLFQSVSKQRAAGRSFDNFAVGFRIQEK